ncbi:hypothetical protein NEDG_01163 [Nematocida displodere]|uniref:Uncharacterized protein n=1 Tax=Nematocida displodere TaxID=1805483 RepID=A0A177EAQ3_9MICR|nr:hypothetical protein NEDG_01163 [Nematocida displodere]
MLYTHTEKHAVVVGDIYRVIKRLVEAKKTVLVITPLAEERDVLERETAHSHVSVKRVLEAERGLAAGQAPDVVVVDKYDIIKSLGLLDRIEKIGEKVRLVIVAPAKPEETEYEVFQEEKRREVFQVNAPDYVHKMAMVFALTKIKPIKGICIVLPTKKGLKRAEVFLKTFGVPTEAEPAKLKDGVVGLFLPDSIHIHAYTLVADLTMSVESTETAVLQIGPTTKTSERSSRFAKLLETGMEYKYRIESVLSLITPHVVSGKRQIDSSIVKHLQGTLRIMK